MGAREAAGRLREAVRSAGRGLVDREGLVEAIALAAVAGEHVLVVGPPGTAKSEAARRVARALGGRTFEYLLGRFTEPSEIFGPVDLRRLRQGEVVTETTGMLPEADVAFLDEVFLGSTAILNTLLGILNERSFRRGSTSLQCPLRVCVGATNALPDDESLAAFADRFLVRVFLAPVPDGLLEELLAGGWTLDRGLRPGASSLADLDEVASAAAAVDLGPVRPRLAHAVRLLRRAGVALSDRRAVKVQRLVAAATALDGRDVAGPADLWPLVMTAPTAEAQEVARDTLRDLLAPAENRALPTAAAEASLGPRARAARIAEAARETLGARPEADDAEGLAAWRLRLEAIGREIDAGFSPDALPPDLVPVRAAVVAAVGP
jgi:MoxR-like ATPase